MILPLAMRGMLIWIAARGDARINAAHYKVLSL